MRSLRHFCLTYFLKTNSKSSIIPYIYHTYNHVTVVYTRTLWLPSANMRSLRRFCLTYFLKTNSQNSMIPYIYHTYKHVTAEYTIKILITLSHYAVHVRLLIDLLFKIITKSSMIQWFHIFITLSKKKIITKFNMNLKLLVDKEDSTAACPERALLWILQHV